MTITRDDLNKQMEVCQKDGTKTFGNREATFCNHPGGSQHCVGDNYLTPYKCPRLMKKFVVRVEPVRSIDIEVSASDEDKAYEEAYSQWRDLEPEMAIVKQE